MLRKIMQALSRRIDRKNRVHVVKTKWRERPRPTDALHRKLAKELGR